MNKQRLKEIEEELMRELTNQEETDSEIDSMTQDLTDKLISQRQTMYEIDNTLYSIAYGTVLNPETNKSEIYVIAYDRAKFALMYEKYKPLKLSAEMNLDLTEYENLKGVVETLIRYKLDKLKVEELED